MIETLLKNSDFFVREEEIETNQRERYSYRSDVTQL